MDYTYHVMEYHHVKHAIIYHQHSRCPMYQCMARTTVRCQNLCTIIALNMSMVVSASLTHLYPSIPNHGAINMHH